MNEIKIIVCIFIIASLIFIVRREMQFKNQIKTKNIRAVENSLNEILSSNQTEDAKQLLLHYIYEEPVEVLRLDRDHLTDEQLQIIKKMIEQHLNNRNIEV